MAGSANGAWAKWRRAKTHLDCLAAEVAGSAQGSPWLDEYPVTPEEQPGGLEYRFYVDGIPPIDAEKVALIVGDLCFNLRAALDHVVYELHVRRYRGRVPDEISETTAFPILDKPRLDSKRRYLGPDKWRETKNLAVVQQRAIEFLQPYNRRNDHLRWVRQSLGDLNDLNRVDKHRRLHIARAQSHAMIGPWFDSDLYGFRVEPFFVPLEGKTEVYRWTFTSLPPDIAEQVNSKHEVAAGVTLYEWRKNRLLFPLAQEVIQTVETVLRRFETFFG